MAPPHPELDDSRRLLLPEPGWRGRLEVAGAQIAVTRFDPPTGSDAANSCPVLLVHGGSANSSWWAPTIAAIVRDRPVGTIDLSGHGHSSWRDAYAFDLWAAEVTAAAEQMFPHGRSLVGHSLGGALACRAVAAGLTARALVLIDAVGSRPRLDRATPAREILPPRFFATREDAEAAVIARKASWPAPLASYVAEQSVEPREDGWRMRRDPLVGVTSIENTALADLAQTPVLVILGRTSPFYGQLATALTHAAQPHVSSVAVDDAGHDVMMDRPNESARIIRGFLRQHDRPRPTGDAARSAR